MIYYKVKPEADQKRRKGNTILISNELYTEKELSKFSIDKKHVEKVEVSKSNIYFCFGARFTNKAAPAAK